MATDQSFVEYIAEQMASAGVISYRKMFGEYALYCNNKVVALVCDNQLFVKPTGAGKAYIGNVVEALPYLGAKPYFLVEEKSEDPDWLGDLIRITEQELPVPKQKKRKIKNKRL